MSDLPPKITPHVPTVDEVYTVLLERIGSGAIGVGSKLPSCRTIADELGSNPSTVNRAIRRLARHGLVRTEPRRGSFLVSVGAAPSLSPSEVEKEIRQAVLLARRSGLGAARIRELFEASLGLGGRHVGVVAFLECNPYDLDRMTTLIENTTGVAIKPMLFDELPEDWEQEFDLLATPIFHLADLAERRVDLDRVVELNFLPSASALRQLATIPADAVVAVVAPTLRGVERMKALASQYYTGAILAPDLSDSAAFDNVDVIIHPAAIDLDKAGIRSPAREIRIDWELDPVSASTFAGRAAAYGENN
jgi:DNA-binding GntR family transcriptional regulator